VRSAQEPFGIDLQKPDTRFKSLRRGLEMRRHLPARPAPRRLEIDENGQGCLCKQIVELVFCGYLQRLAAKKRPVAVAARWARSGGKF